MSQELLPGGQFLKSFWVVTRGALYEVFVQPPRVPLDFVCICHIPSDYRVPAAVIVGIFRTEEMARVCIQSADLRAGDMRWKQYTEAMLAVLIRTIPDFPVSEITDLHYVEPSTWLCDRGHVFV
jgi:hypothetical protein